MKQVYRAILAVTLGVATFFAGQLAIEYSAWWLTGGTASFDDPLINSVRLGVAGSLGLAVAVMIGLRPGRRRRLL